MSFRQVQSYSGQDYCRRICILIVLGSTSPRPDFTKTAKQTQQSKWSDGRGQPWGGGEERYKNIYTDKGKRASRNSKPTEVKEKPPCSNAEKEGGVSSAHLKTQPDSKKNKKRNRPLTLVVQYKLHSCFRWSCCSDDWLQALIDIWLSALMGFPPRVSIRNGNNDLGSMNGIWGQVPERINFPVFSNYTDGTGLVFGGGSWKPSLPPSFSLLWWIDRLWASTPVVLFHSSQSTMCVWMSTNPNK